MVESNLLIYRPFLLNFPPSVSVIVDWNYEKHNQPQNSGGSTRFESEAEVPSEGVSSAPKSPQALHSFFDSTEVLPFDENRFRLVGLVQDATRNKGHVNQMLDMTLQVPVAVKQMPNDWICESHSSFMKQHPFETEHPWLDIGCTRYLNNIAFPYACMLLGVYRDQQKTHVVSELATDGDLFSWCSNAAASSIPPGAAREEAIRPLARQIVDSVRRLHELYLVHRDLSLENLLLSKKTPPPGMQGAGPEENLCVQVIDFGMASSSRLFEHSVRGKPSYQAPEVHSDQEYDGFLSDAFAVGVTLYALVVKDYPWLSTKPGGCKCFEFVTRNGFKAYLRKRKLRGSKNCVADVLTPELENLLCGLLEVDPAKRLTLGEAIFGDRPSVKEHPWLQA